MRVTRFFSFAAPALLGMVPIVALTGGCTSSLTYPATAGKSPARPDVYPCPELMCDAMFGVARSAKNATQDTETVIAFNLPEGVQSTVWNKVQTRLTSRTTAPVRAMTATDTAAFSVEQIRVNGGKAEVDVLYLDRGVWQLATVKFTGGALAPFHLDSITRWVIPATAPTANDPRPAEALAAAEVKAIRDGQDAARAAAKAAANTPTVDPTLTEVAAEETTTSTTTTP
jgi:hypothetical protein